MSQFHIAAPGVQQGVDIPEWLTQEHFDQVAGDQELQENWEPKVGDWYFCGDLYQVMQIASLEKYYSEGEVKPLKSDQGKDGRGHWKCDYFIPAPVAKAA